MQLLVKIFLNEKDLNKRIEIVKACKAVDACLLDDIDKCSYDKNNTQYFEYSLINLPGIIVQEITDYSLFGK